ncbi:MAG: GrpB family protein, partial [Anaeroplasmataceae bacterium]|nr:GrpB family protein [Anaeroplasmataceae bacterium]
SLNKGYTENGFADKVFHLHLRLPNDQDELYFRDYLNAHKEVAKEYEELKIELWKKYEHNRDAYTNAKTEFVKKYTDLAKKNC